MEFGYNLYVVELGPRRLEVMAFLRGLLDLSLQEVKTQTSSLPMKIAEGPVTDLHTLYLRLESLGAKVEYR